MGRHKSRGFAGFRQGKKTGPGRRAFPLTLLPFLYLLLVAPAQLPRVSPLFIDSGFYGYIAQELLRGKILYKEVFEFKFPAIYYLYEWAFALFSDSRWTVYLIDLALNTAVLVLFYLLLKRESLERFFWALGILLVTSYRIFPAFSSGALPEHFFLVFFLTAALLISSRPFPGRDFLTGVCLVFLCMLKQSLILLTAVLAAFYWKRMRKSAFLLAGIALPLIFFVSVFIRGWPESIDATLWYPLAWSRTHHFSLSDIPARLKIVCTQGPGVQFLVILLLSLLRRHPLRPFLLVSSLACAVILFSSPVCFPHYSLILLIPLIFGAVAIARAYGGKVVASTALILAALPVSYIGLTFYFSFRGVDAVVVKRDRGFAAHPAAMVIPRHLKEGETWIMVPSNPTVYFLTKTRSPYRFVAFDAIVPVYYREEVRRLIRQHPPTYVYLSYPAARFEEMFGLTPDEYRLTPVEGELYAFSLAAGSPEKGNSAFSSR